MNARGGHGGLWGMHRGAGFWGALAIILGVGVIESLMGMPVWVALGGMYLSMQLYYRMPPIGDISGPPPPGDDVIGDGRDPYL